MAFKQARLRIKEDRESGRFLFEDKENVGKKQNIENNTKQGFFRKLDSFNAFRVFEKHTQKAMDQYSRNCYIPPLSESFGNLKYEQTTHSGDIVLKNCLAAYSKFPHKLTPQQNQMCIAAIKTALPTIYADSWESEKVRVLAENGWSNFRPELFVVTPRRFGKTTAIATHAVVVTVCVPGFKTVIVAVCKRQSRSLLGMIVQMIVNHPDFKKNGLTIVTMNTDTLEIMWPNGAKCRIDAFPARTSVRLFFILFYFYLN